RGCSEGGMVEGGPRLTPTRPYRTTSLEDDFVQLSGMLERLHSYPVSEDESNVAQRSPTFGEDAAFKNKVWDDAKLVSPKLKR
ncbi:17542_t:CDS:1, partial [Acaulospora colombiana]